MEYLEGQNLRERIDAGGPLPIHEALDIAKAVQQLGPEMGAYMVVSTSETDEKTMRPKEPGMINGGFYQKTDDMVSNHPSVVIAVEDIRESMKKVADAGGKILGGDPKRPGEPGDIPGVGVYCSFIDTEGNRVGMLQPAQM